MTQVGQGAAVQGFFSDPRQIRQSYGYDQIPREAPSHGYPFNRPNRRQEFNFLRPQLSLFDLLTQLFRRSSKPNYHDPNVRNRDPRFGAHGDLYYDVQAGRVRTRPPGGHYPM